MNDTRYSRTDLTQLRDQLCAWRQSHGGRGRLPEDVWIAATTLASTQGVSQVARTLRLDFYKLRRRCGSGRHIQPDASGSAPFVEVQLESSFPNDGDAFRVELTAVSGSRMTISLGRDASTLLTLAEAFWRRAP